MTDNVNYPPHYTRGGVECIDAIQSALTPEEFRGYLKGNVLKYVWRERHKGGTESCEKARWYLNRLVSFGAENATLVDKPAAPRDLPFAYKPPSAA
jgi:Protein of unknwon function (DUF3310)